MSRTACFVGSSTASRRRSTVIGMMTSRYFPRTYRSRSTSWRCPDEVGGPAQFALFHFTRHPSQHVEVHATGSQRSHQQQLKADFEAYLDGFSPNVQDILDNFAFRNQIARLSRADALGTLIKKFTSPDIDLSPSGLDNPGIGTVFEELVRRFKEENNEEAGEHWTPRDAVKLIAKLILLPVADEIESGTYLLYDGACGTGGMLTVAEETLQQRAADHGKQVVTHPYGQEINAGTYAICKADLQLKGQGDAADNIVGGPEHSTLASEAFPSREFDFMLEPAVRKELEERSRTDGR